MRIDEVRAEDNLYFSGPFWLIADSLESINNGQFIVVDKKYLVNYDGSPFFKIPEYQSTHKYIWNNLHLNQVYGHDYDYYPRGRVIFQHSHLYLNIPEGLNVSAIKKKILDTFDYKRDFDKVFYKDPKSGGHYHFQLR